MPVEFPEVVSTERACTLGQIVSGGCTDGPGASHDHVGDVTSRLAEVARLNDFELVGKKALLDQPHAITSPVKRNGAVMARVASGGNVQADDKWGWGSRIEDRRRATRFRDRQA
jgi:hypothetical protein